MAMQQAFGDQHWMAAAVALSQRSHALSAPNPNVGCILVKEGRVVGRGVTAAGGRPHAEAAALSQAGSAAEGATAYVTLEPCAHISARGPSCADSLIGARMSRVVIATQDPDPRTNGQGIAKLKSAGIAVKLGVLAAEARSAMAGWWTRQTLRRPFITLKMATSLDGCIALADGSSQWITGERARAHGHLERARHQAILVGRGTYDADAPRLDVRLPGLESRSPQRLLLSHTDAPANWTGITSPDDAARLARIDSILIEGGAGAASAFLERDMVDRLLLYRAPILIGAGRHALGAIGLDALPQAHDRWALKDRRQLGRDQLEIYERIKKE
jgi:diaminohydroxyphosphoribosylaminopyrimidine deaminase/5-amino-6-(5-phosphoribosylamino)uracil reductase